MKRYNETDYFIKSLAFMYKSYPYLEIKSDTIYDDLRTFNSNGRIIKNDITYIQRNMSYYISNKYITNSNIKEFFFGNSKYFWAYENRANFNEQDYYDVLHNAIKIYVAVDEDNLEYVAKNVFDFMAKNNIVNQSKIARETRNDVLVLRVATIEDAKNISNYINNQLVYNPNTKPNPFLYNEGKVSFAMDGPKSFNKFLSIVMELYFKNRRSTNSLDFACLEDFKSFVNNELRNILCISDEEYVNCLNCIKHGIEVGSAIYDVVMYHILLSNINGNINSLDFFRDFQNIHILNTYYNNMGINKPSQQNISNNSYDNLSNKEDLTSYKRLIEYYIKNARDTNHLEIIDSYINDGNIKYFTRQDGIRNYVLSNFSPTKLRNVMNEFALRTLVSAFNNTYNKYGYQQAYQAVNDLFINKNYNLFTNDGNFRVLLQKCISLESLNNYVYSKIVSEGKEYSVDNIVEYLFNLVSKYSFSPQSNYSL